MEETVSNASDQVQTSPLPKPRGAAKQKASKASPSPAVSSHKSGGPKASTAPKARRTQRNKQSTQKVSAANSSLSHPLEPSAMTANTTVVPEAVILGLYPMHYGSVSSNAQQMYDYSGLPIPGAFLPTSTLSNSSQFPAYVPSQPPMQHSNISSGVPQTYYPGASIPGGPPPSSTSSVSNQFPALMPNVPPMRHGNINSNTQQMYDYSGLPIADVLPPGSTPMATNQFSAPIPNQPPMQHGNVGSNAPQTYHPGISFPGGLLSTGLTPGPKFQNYPARPWIPLGPRPATSVNGQPDQNMWMPATHPPYGTGVQTTYPGMALAGARSQQPQNPFQYYLSGPLYTLAATGPKSFLLTVERDCVLKNITRGFNVPDGHLWATVAELFLCKSHYLALARGAGDPTMECSFDLSPYLKWTYGFDVPEVSLVILYENLDRFMDRWSVWQWKASPQNRKVWEAMAGEVEAAFERLAPETKQLVYAEWKGYGRDGMRNAVKRVELEALRARRF